MPPVVPQDGAAKAPEVERRIAELSAEAESTTDRRIRAALLYEIAHLTEHVLRNSAKAVQDYLAAYNTDTRMRLALYALLRIFERKRSYKNLARLYDAELRGAQTPEEKASALIDQASLATATGGDAEGARRLLEQAIEAAPESLEASLLLEYGLRAAADEAAAARIVERRANHTDDPIIRGVLLLEVARLREASADVGGALDALKRAALERGAHETFLVALARFARQHGYFGELVEATERHAELLSSSWSSANPAESPETLATLRSRAVALWYEAARLRCSSLGDPEGALAALARAAALSPDDPLIRRTRMLAYDLLEDRERAAEEARELLARGLSGAVAAPLHFRIAESALVQGDVPTARKSLIAAIEQAGLSPAADAMLDDLLFDEGDNLERIERRELRAHNSAPPRAARWLVEAALIAAHELGDGERFLRLFLAAAEHDPDNVESARDAYGAATDLGHADALRATLDALLKLESDPDEWIAVLHHRVELATSQEEALRLLEAHLDDPRGRGLIAELLVVFAAEHARFGLLGRAHEALAREDEIGVTRAAKHAAAARAFFRAGAVLDAERNLRASLDHRPAGLYARTMLEEILRARGGGEEVIDLLRKAAEQEQSAKEAELALLVAGAAAEGASDAKRAALAYEEAADRNPESVGPLWALLRLSQETSDRALELRAREGLAAREQAQGGAGLETLLLAEHYDLHARKPELAERGLLMSLAADGIGAHAAVAMQLLGSGSANQRMTALDKLALLDEGSSRAAVDRAHLFELLTSGGEGSALRELAARVLAGRPDDRLALFTRTLLPEREQLPDHAAALEAFAANVADAAIADAARAEAIEARLLAGLPLDFGKQLGATPGPLASFVIATFAGPDQPKARALALSTLGGAAAPEERAALLRAEARALFNAGDMQRAYEALRAVLDQDPEDLAALELMRMVARRAGRLEEVVHSCLKLAACVTGELWAQLLEEAAAMRMDFLDDSLGAEDLLRQVYERYPNRAVTYGRLHDLLSERASPEALIELVRARSEQVDNPIELAQLFYELARLYRANDELDLALSALDNLAMLDEHVGGLALAAEIHTSQGNWAGAVEALRSLATAKHVPADQQRLARLGAADFLENRLHDSKHALAELELLEREGTPDLALYVRIADVAERAGEPERAVEALLAASEIARGDERIEVLMRAADLTAAKLHKVGEAAALYERVVAQRPGHGPATKGLLGLSADEAKKAMVLNRFDNEVRAECHSSPTSPEALRRLLTLAELRASPDISYVALSALSTLGLATLQEREQAELSARRLFGARVDPDSPLDDVALRELLTPPADERYLAFSRLIGSAAKELDQIEPARFGVGRTQRISPRETNQVRDEISAMMMALGMKPGDFYVGGDEPTRIAALPGEDAHGFVVGMGIAAPLSAVRRHQAAVQVAALYLGSTPLQSRPLPQYVRLLYAAMLSADIDLPEAGLAADLAADGKALGRVLPRRVRKVLGEYAQLLPEGGLRMDRHARLLLRQTRRLALLLAGDLTAAIEGILGPSPALATITQTEDALDLLRAWTSQPMAALRKRVGLAK